MAPGLPDFACRDLLANVGQDALADAARACRHHFEFGRLAVAGDEVEDAADVAPDRRVGREQRQVGVDARGLRVIVAGADVAVGGELRALATNDQAELGVGLQFDEAIDDVHAGAFEVARPADVGRLVEAGLQLHDRRDRFAGLDRLLQGLHDRAVARRAIERPLDGHDVGIGHRLAQVLHHDVEALVGVMDDDVLLADRGEAVAIEFADALGEADVERLELQLGPVGRNKLRGIGEGEQPFLDEHRMLVDLEFVDHHLAQLIGHAAVDLEPDHVAAAAALELRSRTSGPDPRLPPAVRCHCRGGREMRPGCGW